MPTQAEIEQKKLDELYTFISRRKVAWFRLLKKEMRMNDRYLNRRLEELKRRGLITEIRKNGYRLFVAGRWV